MKKIFTLAFIFICACFSVQAQNTKDAKYHQDLVKKLIKLYNPNENRGSKYLLKQADTKYYNEDGAGSYGILQTKYTYDSKGFSVGELTQGYDTLLQKWLEYIKIVYTNDTKGNMLKGLIYSNDNGIWLKRADIIQTFDNNSNMTKLIYLSYTTQKDSTDFEFEVDFTYDTKNILTKTVSKSLSKFSTPYNIYYQVTIPTYNADATLASEKFLSGETLATVVWSGQSEYTYDTKKNNTKDESFIVTGGVKDTMPSSRFTYTYNTKNQLTKLKYESIDFGGSEMLIEKSNSNYTYDVNDNLSNEKENRFSNLLQKMYFATDKDYTYFEFVGTKEISTIDFSISPNPTSDFLQIKTNETILYTAIFDINGRLQKTIKGDVKNIDLQGLSNAPYFLQVYSEKGMGVCKFIKK
jgi:Secretion system C-terminal sorting domain